MPAQNPGDAPIRLLIVDDSIVARTVLTRILEARPDFVVAGSAASVSGAFALLDGGLSVDVILLDLEMPGTDGLTALPELLKRSHGARALIVSGACGDGAAATVRALTLGAADTLLKPGAAAFSGRFGDELADRLRRIGRRDIAGRGLIRGTRSARQEPVRCLAVGASTGGPHALATFFAALDPAFAAPILVTQHLPAPFIPIFAAQLRGLAGRSVEVAKDGARLLPGAILLAPGDAHLGLSDTGGKMHVALDRQPSASGCMPSVDPMFRAVAAYYGGGTVAVVLTGMGRDGAEGAAAVVRSGGEVFAQDEATSVVWGMPGAVAQSGVATMIAPPAALATRISRRAARIA